MQIRISNSEEYGWYKNDFMSLQIAREGVGRGSHTETAAMRGVMVEVKMLLDEAIEAIEDAMAVWSGKTMDDVERTALQGRIDFVEDENRELRTKLASLEYGFKRTGITPAGTQDPRD